MNKYHIELTAPERTIFEQIDLRVLHRNHDECHTAYNANKDPALALVSSLTERKGVPAQRLRYWNDPRYNYGRIKASRKGLFERNGCTGAGYRAMQGVIFSDPPVFEAVLDSISALETPLNRNGASRSGAAR